MKQIVITITENDKNVVVGNATVTVEGEQVYTWNTAADRSINREEGSIQVGMFVIDSLKKFEGA